MKKILLFIAAFYMTVCGFAQEDIGVISINTPESACGLGSETIQVDIFNFGEDIGITAFDVSYQIDGGPITSQTQTYLSFSSAETKIVTFVAEADLSMPGAHEVKIFTEYGGDEDTSNDTLTVEIINFPPSEGGTLMEDATICEGGEYTLTLEDEVGSVLNWESSVDDGGVWVPIVSEDTFLLVTGLTETTTYRVHVQSGDCDDAYSTEVTISVDAAPIAGEVGDDAEVCILGNSGTLNLTGYTGTIEFWQMNEGAGWTDLAVTDDFYDYVDLTVTTSFRAVVGNGVCDADTSTIATITVLPEPIGGTLEASAIVCLGMNDGTLTLTDYTGEIIQWERSEDGGVTWIPIVNVTPTQSYTDLAIDTRYRVRVAGGGCPAVYSDTVTITVVSPPDAGLIEEDKSVCTGADDTLYLVDYSGDVLKWQFDEGAGWMDIITSSDSLFIMDITTTTSYRAIVTNNICPDDTTDLVTITVIATTVGGTIIESDSVCFANNGATLELEGHVGNITWWETSTNEGVTWSPIVNMTTSQAYVDLEESTWYRVLVEGINCPNDYSDTAQITVYIPEVDITANGDTEFCEGNSVELEATEGYDSYDWTNGSTESSTIVDESGYQVVTIADANGCVNSDSILITVFELPVADAGLDQTISLGQSVILMGNGGVEYLWSPAITLDDATLQNPTANPLEDTWYGLLVTDENGCVDTDSVQITINKDYNFKPNNIITPNGDGFNDTWIIDNIHAYPETKVIVVNRYGHLVYEQVAYDNSWTGELPDGTLVDGTYYYVIESPDSEIIFEGHLTILSK